MKLVGRVPLAALEDGKLVRIPYPPFDVLVTTAGGKPVAIEDACNHAGASLSTGTRSSLRPDCVVCPMHGYVFDLRDGHVVVPQGLCDDQRTFVTTVEGSDVVVWDPVEITIR
jgi:nitrite reductase/ring-hydroxylating ferredoxin subunit